MKAGTKPDVNDRAQVGEQAVKDGGNGGSFARAPAEEGNALCVRAQPCVNVAESPLQVILLRKSLRCHSQLCAELSMPEVRYVSGSCAISDRIAVDMDCNCAFHDTFRYMQPCGLHVTSRPGKVTTAAF